MDEADLLRERLQAITDKRKLQEDIVKKKLEIEEEKLKLQYLKKKSLREQWLMDGLSPQSEQEQEAMKLQVLNEQKQAGVLQRNIHRIEKEIEALESRELTISENEMLVLQRLKEVEKTAADIIKEVNADIQPDPIQYVYSAIPDIPKSFKPSKQLKKMSSPKLDPDPEESKQALFVMEINVQKDMRTGKSQVLSTATVTTEDLPKKGIKVYDDGRKSVYALPSDAQRVQNGVGELTPQEVEELLRKATEKSLEADVEYHDPVFSSPYSRPSTPKRQNLDQLSPRPAPRRESFKNVTSSQNIQNSEVTLLQGQKIQELSHIPLHWSTRKVQQPPEHSKGNQNNIPISGQTPLDFEMYFDGNRCSPALSIEGDRAALPLDSSLSHQDPFPEISKLNILNTMPENIDSSKPVSMIFMGYQNADNDEEGEVIQAELVVINDDDNSPDMQLSYHPDGCCSKVFQPKMNRSSKAKQYLADTRSTLNQNYTLPDATVQVQGQQSGLSQAQQSFEQMVDDGTKDPSTTALRMRMARLGKRV
ncbi:palmdelphin isoform X4 [Paramormyrops kingsleyae]|uniref:palmdelphin isoform X4 n=1 Tax=Paramormyrops kingsleyae TaxID=1676925 RepID=UPI000CD5F8F3|nr:palmdelphin isoform X5 [Paramormyrops kingsleyae]